MRFCTGKTFHEKIIKRDDGSRIKILIWLTVHGTISLAAYEFDVHRCKKGKRTWNNSYDPNDYAYRALRDSDKGEYEAKSKLLFASKEEILGAAMELWESLKPTIKE